MEIDKLENTIVSHAKSYQNPEESNSNENNSISLKKKLSFSANIFNKYLAIIEKLMKNDLKDVERKPLEVRKHGYKRVKEGGIECTNEEELKCQEGIVSDLLKSAGKTLMEGKNVVGISLPVRIFEPRSTIERITDWWAFGPIYLTKAATIKVTTI